MKKIFFVSSLTIMALLVLVSPYGAFAHERRVYQISVQDYTFVVGFLNEPVVVDDKSGVELSVMLGNGAPTMGSDGDMDGPPANTTPTSGLEKTLKIELSAGSEKKILDLAPAYGAPGHYSAVFYPSAETTYTFRIFGTINNVSVDVAFPCNAGGEVKEDMTATKISDKVVQKFKTGGFGCPVSKMDRVFPAPTVSLDTLDQKVAAIGSAAAGAGSKGTIAIILGLAGLLAGAGAWLRRSRM